MTSNFSFGLREEVPALVIDHAHLAEDVAGEILEHGVAERGEDRAIAFGDGDVLGAGLSATSVEMPPPNWVMKVFGAFLIT